MRCNYVRKRAMRCNYKGRRIRHNKQEVIDSSSQRRCQFVVRLKTIENAMGFSFYLFFAPSTFRLLTSDSNNLLTLDVS